VILGAGVVGLSTAIRIRQIPEQPYEVILLSQKFHPETTSDGSGGFWLPFATKPFEKVNEWSRKTLPILCELASKRPDLVTIRDSYLLYSKLPPPEEMGWKNDVLDLRELREDEKRGASHGYFFRSANLISQRYMKYLMQQCDQLGVQFFRYTIDNIQQVFRDWKQADIFVSCLGVNSHKIFNDNQVSPIRGVLVHLKEKKPRFNKIMCWDDNPAGFTYIISREDKCILGGTAEEGNWNPVASQEEADKIYERCMALAPELKDSEIIGKWCGLRPGRTELRLELDMSYGRPIIHNYGHGGSGMTLHWGTADEAVEILREAMPIYGVIRRPKL